MNRGRTSKEKAPALEVRFWGVRGSLPCPGASYTRFGGNTSCIEVKVGDRRLVFDAGSGLRLLGESFLRDDVRATTLLLSHTHWDHTIGLPFFKPAYVKKHTLRVLAGHLGNNGGVRGALAQQMTAPIFPVPIEALRARAVFEDFDAGDAFALFPGIRVRSAPLHHPNGATGYRVEAGGRAVCYVTDTEHVPGKPDEKILGLIEGADLVIYDSTYSDTEFAAHIGWGHSTWQEGVRLCRAAGAKRLAIFHHDPAHDDAYMTQLDRAARKVWAGARVAREGDRIRF